MVAIFNTAVIENGMAYNAVNTDLKYIIAVPAPNFYVKVDNAVHLLLIFIQVCCQKSWRLNAYRDYPYHENHEHAGSRGKKRS